MPKYRKDEKGNLYAVDRKTGEETLIQAAEDQPSGSNEVNVGDLEDNAGEEVQED